MKVFLDCRSTLLQKSLEKFLKETVSSEEESDIVVTDYERRSGKPRLRIGSDRDADLCKPFSRSQLFIKLEEKLAQEQSVDLAQDFYVEEESLEERIEEAARRFVEEVVALVKEHREKGR
jgi:hypothetical protein